MGDWKDEKSALPVQNAIILDTESKSNVIDVRGYSAISFMMPAAWTAADIGLLHSNDPADATPQDALDGAGNRLKVTVDVDETVSVPASIVRAVASYRYIWLESIDTSDETPVAQGDDRTVIVVLG